MAERKFEIGDTVVVTGDTAWRDHEFDPGTVGDVTYVYSDGDYEVCSGDLTWIVGGDDLEPCRLSSHYTVKEDGGIIQNVDMVNHPPHYRAHPKGIECIDVIEDNPFVNLAQSQKYVWRVSWGGKGDDIEDLEKAVWYLNREIARRKK